jgi:hypothetical protein
MSRLGANRQHMTRPVAAMRMDDIEARAYDVLDDIAPGFVGSVAALNVGRLIDYELPKRNIHFSPVDDAELTEAWALSQTDGRIDDPIEVLVRVTEWNEMFATGSGRAHHARGTFAHESGHVFLHVHQFRRRARANALPRERLPQDVARFREPEWQAFAFGGCMLAPRPSIMSARTLSVKELAWIFDTSPDLMRLHLKRLGLWQGD